MRYLFGVLLILLSGASFGAAPIFARFAYEAQVSPIMLLFLRFGMASLLLIFIMILGRYSWPRGGVLFGLILMGAFGYVGQSFCYFTALTFIPAGLVALLLYLYPAIVTLFSKWILKENLSTIKMVALFIALIGMVLTIGPSGGRNPIGLLLAIGAAFIYSGYILTGSRMVKPGKAIPSSCVIMISAAMVYGVMILFKGEGFPMTTKGWVSAMALAFISTVVAAGSFLAGLERVGPVIASTLSTIEPVVTVFLAALILNERMTSIRLIGGSLILLAVLLLIKQTRTMEDSKKGNIGKKRILTEEKGI
jgi:drug/metabolite transporter (DMT)-like permease